MEWNNILKKYDTSPLNLTGTRSRGKTVHVMLWMYGRAYLRQFWLNCIEKVCFLKIVVNYIIGFAIKTEIKFAG